MLITAPASRSYDTTRSPLHNAASTPRPCSRLCPRIDHSKWFRKLTSDTAAPLAAGSAHVNGRTRQSRMAIREALFVLSLERVMRYVLLRRFHFD